MPATKLPLLDAVTHCRVDEMIWGHRLRQDQTAWLLLLEMLNVAQACLNVTGSDPLPDMGVAEIPNARPPMRIRFRNLLFRFNQKAAELAAKVEAGTFSSTAAWDKWLETVRDEYDQSGGADYSPLKDRFDDFVEFERAIDLVRSTAITNPDAVKDVYTPFIFPLCPEALYWEATSKAGGKIDKTANSFTRAGTLLHIMLARSADAERMRPLLAQFLRRDSRAGRLVRQLQVPEPADTDHEHSAPQTYLPYPSHPRFDQLGKDFAQILSLSVPDNDRLLWLVPLAALHLSIYHAEVAAGDHLDMTLPLPLVCEIIGQRNVVREISVEHLKKNRDLARRAVEKFLNEFFAGPEWQSLVVQEANGDRDAAIENAKALIQKRLSPPPAELEEAAKALSLSALCNAISGWFMTRHRREFSDVHFQYGREAGLIAIRGTNRYRYAPTDQLLKSLVLANVSHEMQLEEFLSVLFLRYGLVIGSSQQAVVAQAGHRELAKRVSQVGFRNNQTRLESRLKSMGMLRRLSDSQAYIINPLQPR